MELVSLQKRPQGGGVPGVGGERPRVMRGTEVHETPDPLAPPLWTSRPPDCEKSISVFLSHPVFLLQSPEQTKTDT